ncbi:MAG: Mini-ribonuclease 3 [Oscillospiraceae bacterium]|nr:Mini-ribonuclease 3 [Oscillospiraceae bacterium]
MNLGKDIQNVNPLVFAYMGDVLYEKSIREYLITANNSSNVHKLHETAIKFVSAKYQSLAFKHIIDELSDDEMNIYKWGRNSKSKSQAKSTSIINYRISTGLECLLGYLYFKGNSPRIDEIMSIIIDFLLDEDKKDDK